MTLVQASFVELHIFSGHTSQIGTYNYHRNTQQHESDRPANAKDRRFQYDKTGSPLSWREADALQQHIGFFYCLLTHRPVMRRVNSWNPISKQSSQKRKKTMKKKLTDNELKPLAAFLLAFRSESFEGKFSEELLNKLNAALQAAEEPAIKGHLSSLQSTIGLAYRNPAGEFENKSWYRRIRNLENHIDTIEKDGTVRIMEFQAALVPEPKEEYVK
jgi:hypothetical protein